MRTAPNTLIAELVGDLQPIRPLSMRDGLSVTAASVGAILTLVVLTVGVRSDLLAGGLNPVFLLAAGLFLMLGISASIAVIAMSRPQVGNEHGGWIWAAAMAALMPLVALALSISNEAKALAEASPALGINCLMTGGGLSLLVGATLTLWLRRGAPTSPQRAGLLTGVAAGSLGIFAFSFNCPHSDIYHIGLWHSAVVVVSAAVGRIVVPKLIAW